MYFGSEFQSNLYVSSISTKESMVTSFLYCFVLIIRVCDDPIDEIQLIFEFCRLVPWIWGSMRFLVR